MGISFWQILIVVLLGVLLFGRGKISELMGDVAKGIKSFRKGMTDDDIKEAEPKNITGEASAQSTTEVKNDEKQAS